MRPSFNGLPCADCCPCTADKGEQFHLTLRNTLRQRVQRGGCTETFQEAIRGPPRCGTRIEMCRNWTHVCVERFEDASLDFVYVDALHDCTRELATACLSHAYVCHCGPADRSRAAAPSLAPSCLRVPTAQTKERSEI